MKIAKLHEKKNQQGYNWLSRLGLILAAASAAVGLGNLQRFPQLVAMHGGGAFLLLYLLCVLLLGWPLMLVEMSLGRATQANPIKSFTVAVPHKKQWRYVGILAVVTAFLILTYYAVSCVWTIAFMGKMIVHITSKQLAFSVVTSRPFQNIPLLITFYTIIVLVVQQGFDKGMKRLSLLMMPLLFTTQFILVWKVMSLQGSWVGLKQYVVPNFAQLSKASLFHALSQAFFSLCIGEAVLISYGRRASKQESLPLTAGYIALLDTLVALLGGLIIIPAMHITGESPEQGISLIYNTLWHIGQPMLGGKLFLGFYFLGLAIAGLTTCVALLDIVSNVASEYFGISKKSISIQVSIVAFFCSLLSLYSKGGSSWLSTITIGGAKGVYEIFDFLWGSISMVIGGLLTTLFVGWIWGANQAAEELSSHQSTYFSYLKKGWAFYIKWFIPWIIVYILYRLIVSNGLFW